MVFENRRNYYGFSTFFKKAVDTCKYCSIGAQHTLGKEVKTTESGVFENNQIRKFENQKRQGRSSRPPLGDENYD